MRGAGDGMKYIFFGGALSLIGACIGFPAGAMFAPRYRIRFDGTQTGVCGNEFGEPGMIVGLLAGLLLGIWLAYYTSRTPIFVPDPSV
jgi:hypothetical protein